MFRITRDPSSGGHLHILTKVLQIHGASPYSRRGGCIGEPVCVHCLPCGRGLQSSPPPHFREYTQWVPLCSQPPCRLYGLAPWICSTLVRIWRWPPEDGSLMIRNTSGWSEFYIILMCFNKMCISWLLLIMPSRNVGTTIFRMHFKVVDCQRSSVTVTTQSYVDTAVDHKATT